MYSHSFGCVCFYFAPEFLTWVFLVFQVPLQYRDVSVGGRAVSIRAQVTTEAPAKVEKVSKKMEEGVVVNKYRPKEPYVGRCLLNTKITGDDAPGETWHMVFSTEGMSSFASFSFSINI
jgi:hypothetical protein